MLFRSAKLVSSEETADQSVLGVAPDDAGEARTLKLLLEYETIDVPMIDAVMEGRESPPPMGWSPGGPARDEPKPITIGGPAPQT